MYTHRDLPKEPDVPDSRYTRDHDSKRFVWSESWKPATFTIRSREVYPPPIIEKFHESQSTDVVSRLNESFNESRLVEREFSTASSFSTFSEDPSTTLDDFESKDVETVSGWMTSAIDELKSLSISFRGTLPPPASSTVQVSFPQSKVLDFSVKPKFPLDANIPFISNPSQAACTAPVDLPHSAMVDLSARPKFPVKPSLPLKVGFTSPILLPCSEALDLPVRPKVLRIPLPSNKKGSLKPLVGDTSSLDLRKKLNKSRLDKAFVQVQQAIETHRFREQWRKKLDLKFPTGPTKPLYMINPDGSIEFPPPDMNEWRCSSPRELREIEGREYSRNNPTTNQSVLWVRNILSEDEDSDHPRVLRLSQKVNMSVQRSVPGPPRPVDFDRIYLPCGKHVPRSQQALIPYGKGSTLKSYKCP